MGHTKSASRVTNSVTTTARALMGKQAGDTISLGNSEAEILAIESR
jgi:transcription elongation GreA/GreB family factor